MRTKRGRPLTIASIRADLSVAKQEQGEDVDNFVDRIVGLTHRANPAMAHAWIQRLSVPEFIKGINDKVDGQEKMKFGKPQTITDADEHDIRWDRSVTNRHVVFNDDVAEATPQTSTVW